MVDSELAPRLRSLAAALREADLARVRVAGTSYEIELSRGPRGTDPAPAGFSGAAEVPEALPPPKPDIIASDVVGILRYLRPAAAEGQALEGDRELAHVEALGVRNPVRSRGGGRIAAVYVADGSPVEYGQPLYAIER